MYSTTRLAVGLCAILVVSGTSAAYAADGFEKVRCDRPIIPALIGARSANERVARIEARRKAIGLKDLGADEIETGVGTINWLICGREFAILDVRNVFADVVEMPPHSREEPAFSSGGCQWRGTKIEDSVLGVFDASVDGKMEQRPIKAAWRIDLKHRKFVPLEKGTTCQTNGIFTVDLPK